MLEAGLTIQSVIVIFLADKLSVIHHIELLPRHQLLPADETGEALEVEDLVPRLPDQVLGRDALATAATLGPVPPDNNPTISQLKSLG